MRGEPGRGWLYVGTLMSKSSFRIFATCDIGDSFDLLRERGYQVEVYPGPEAPPKALVIEKVCSGVDGLITTLRDPIDAEVFEAGKDTLKGVAQYAVGYDNINRADANRYGIPFTHTAEVLTDATAEFALAMLLAVSRKLAPSEELVREQRWGSWHPYLPFLGDEVTGKTLAVIGMGRIGQALIRKVAGLEMNVLCCDPACKNDSFANAMQKLMDSAHELGLSTRRNWIRNASLEECLGEADYVSLHVPLLCATDSDKPTYHLINARTLRMMKPTAYLINTARGPIVDEKALYTALKERWIAGAALDVFEQEPLPANSPLRDPELADRLRLFPHFASGGVATRLSSDPNVGMAGRCVQGLIDMMEENHGGDVTKMPYVVNKEVFRARKTA